MRTLLFVSAAVHAALFALVFLTSTLDVMLAAVLGVAFALAFGLLALIRNGPIPTMWVATAGGLVALTGWGSWLVYWALDPTRTATQPVNIIGLLPPVAVVLFLVAALLPSTRRA